MTPQEKNIFSYTLGDKVVYCDPLDVYVKFVTALQGEHDLCLADARQPPDGVEESPPEKVKRLLATARLVQAARACFGMPEVDPQTGEGHPGDACLRALYGWLEWLEKKSAPPTASPPTSPPPTARKPSPSTTRLSGACG